MRKGVNIGKSFENLVKWSFPLYKGIRIERCEGGFIIFGTRYNCWEDATEAVDKSFKELNNTINQNE